MGDALQRVLDGVGEVVHGEDAPLGALPVVFDVADAVEGRVPQVEVAAGQVDLGPQGVLSVRELPGPHPAEEVQTLLRGPVPPGGAGGGVYVPPVRLELFRRQLTDVSQALFDKVLCQLVGLFKVVASVEQPVPPVEPQPVDILLDGLHELHVLLGGIGVVKAEVAQAAVLLGGTEVDAQRLAVADVQIAVGLRRETGMDGHALEPATLRDVLVDELMNEILAFGLLGQESLRFLGHVVTLLTIFF